jgi:hypothetical protein
MKRILKFLKIIYFYLTQTRIKQNETVLNAWLHC